MGKTSSGTPLPSLQEKNPSNHSEGEQDQSPMHPQATGDDSAKCGTRQTPDRVKQHLKK